MKAGELSPHNMVETIEVDETEQRKLEARGASQGGSAARRRRRDQRHLRVLADVLANVPSLRSPSRLHHAAHEL